MVIQSSPNVDFSPSQQNIIDQHQLLASISRSGNLASMGQHDLLTEDLGQSESSINTDMMEFGIEFRETFSGLSDSATELSLSDEESVFAERSVELSDSDLAQAEVATGATRDEFEVVVEELATAQQEESIQFVDDELYFEQGEFEFSLEQGVREETLTIEVESDDTNLAVLDRIAQEIETTELDVTAEIRGDEGEVSLQLRSDEVGEVAAFNIEDIDQSTLISQLELETLSQASDAQVSVSGIEEEEVAVEGDQVSIGDNEIELNLLDTGQFEVEVRSDMEAIMGGVEDFASAFNQALDFAEDAQSGGDLASQRDLMVSMARFESSNLRNIGVEVASDGSLDIDESRLERSIEERIDTVETRLGGRTGFASRIEQRAEQTLEIPPSELVDEVEEQGFVADLNSFSNFGLYTQFGEISSPFSYMQQGFMFDFFI